VARILQTPGFARSERLKRFLSFAVERFLAGDAGSLKEYSIALDVFDRSPDYNPKIDPGYLTLLRGTTGNIRQRGGHGTAS
jgi:hypothetical protein